MEERDFYDERQETKKATLICPHCRQEGEYDLGWFVRTKKRQLPGRADERVELVLVVGQGACRHQGVRDSGCEVFMRREALGTRHEVRVLSRNSLAPGASRLEPGA